jgi:hypothetical protein
LNLKKNFEDLAFEMLDNDPMVDELGIDEKTKRQIVNTLWSTHKSTHKSVTPSVENEEDVTQLGNSAEQEGYAACLDQYNGVLSRSPRNPYAKGSQRHQAWEKGFSKAEQGMWTPLKREENEEQQVNDKTKPTASSDQQTFEFVWKDGKVERAKGSNIADAFKKAGYGASAVGALDYYKEVDGDEEAPPTS